jgi:hypothetical protein
VNIKILKRLELPAMALLGFVATLGVWRWEQRSAAPQHVLRHSPVPQPLRAPATPAVDRYRGIFAAGTAPASHPPAAAVIASAAVAPPSSGEGIEGLEGPVDPSLLDVPVRVMPHLPADESTGSVTVLSTTNQPLSVDVTISRSQSGSGSIAHVDLRPRERMDLADQGFIVGRGDAVTLHSPPYRDREVVIR